MYNIDKPQERRKATGTGGIPPENIRLRRTLTTEYLQLSLCYTNLSCHSISVVITASRTAFTGSMVHEKMEIAAVSVMKNHLMFERNFSRSAFRFVSRTRDSIFR